MPILHRKTPQIISASAPWYQVFDGLSTIIVAPPSVTLNNLPSNPPWMIEMWANFVTADAPSLNYWGLAQKYSNDDFVGWYFEWVKTASPGNIEFAIFPDDYPFVDVNIANNSKPIWRHIVGYHHTDNKIRVAINGVWGNWSADAHIVAGYDDSAYDLILGMIEGTFDYYLDGKLGWVRISTIDRYNGASGSSFIPPYRSVIPTTDANTILLYGMNEQSGTIVNDLSGNGNNGLITGTYAWGKGYG